VWNANLTTYHNGCVFCTFLPVPSQNIKKNKVSGTCSMYGRQRRCIQGFGGETWRKMTTWKTLHKLEDTIEMDLQEVEERHGLDWYGSGWRLVNAVPFHKMWGVSWLGEDMLASDKGLCFMELLTCVLCRNQVMQCCSNNDFVTRLPNGCAKHVIHICIITVHSQYDILHINVQWRTTVCTHTVQFCT